MKKILIEIHHLLFFSFLLSFRVRIAVYFLREKIYEETKITIVMVSHSIPILQEICNKVICLDKRIVDKENLKQLPLKMQYRSSSITRCEKEETVQEVCTIKGTTRIKENTRALLQNTQKKILCAVDYELPQAIEDELEFDIKQGIKAQFLVSKRNGFTPTKNQENNVILSKTIYKASEYIQLKSNK